MAANYASVSDVTGLWRPLTASEQTMVGTLLTMVSAELRTRAHQRGRDLDAMIGEDPDLAAVAKSVCVDVVRRYVGDLDQTGGAMSQITESALGYSQTGTYLVPGGGIFIKENELKRLGLKRQRFGVMDLC